MRAARLGLLAAIGVAAPATAQQVSDSGFSPAILQPAFAAGAGPVVAVDQAHHNFHTASGRYYPFAQVLRRDGFVVDSILTPVSAASLAPVRVLVVSNPLNGRNAGNWTLPTPSAFTAEEISVVRAWVVEGGSLLLIADHMPFAGAAAELAAAFGVRFNNGFAVDTAGDGGPDLFRRADGTLGVHPITTGRLPGERIDSVATFTGSALQADDTYAVLLRFGPGIVSLMPDTAWQFTDATRRVAVSGWAQGVAGPFGKGRVVVLGEAAMFSAQLAGPSRQPAGMNHPMAAQDAQFLLNTLHWLAGLLPLR